MEKWRAKPRRCLDQDVPSPCSVPHPLRLTETRSQALPLRLGGGSLPLLHLGGGAGAGLPLRSLPPRPPCGAPMPSLRSHPPCRAVRLLERLHLHTWHPGQSDGATPAQGYPPPNTHTAPCPLEAPFPASPPRLLPELCRGWGWVLGLPDCPSADALSPSSTLPPAKSLLGGALVPPACGAAHLSLAPWRSCWWL